MMSDYQMTDMLKSQESGYSEDNPDNSFLVQAAQNNQADLGVELRNSDPVTVIADDDGYNSIADPGIFYKKQPKAKVSKNSPRKISPKKDKKYENIDMKRVIRKYFNENVRVQ